MYGCSRIPEHGIPSVGCNVKDLEVSFGQERAEDFEAEEPELERGTSDEIYIAALYWSLATMSTIGYGDIAAANSR